MLYRAGRHREALDACRQVLAAQPNQPDVLSFAGMIALELGETVQAVLFYEAAVARKPDFAEAHYNLGNALMRLGRSEDAVTAYRRAARHRPDLVAIHNNLGNALQALERFGEAAEAYERALAIEPQAAELQRNLGIVLQKAGRPGEAIAAYRRTVSLKPDWPLGYSSLANALMEQGEAQGVVEACEAWLRASPGANEAIVLKSVALNELGDREGARQLVDLDRFVRIIDFTEPPAGFASMAEFNAALSRHALTHPTLHLPPAADPRYHCPTLRITEEFLAEPKGPAAHLETIINQVVGNYLATVARQDPSHPYLVKPPRRWRITSWAAVLDRQGNLLPHVHFSGYVSGVYYPKIPEGVDRIGESRAGWFELGRPPDDYRCKAVPEVRVVQPREGRMILFPSYFYHRTIPFESAEPRISLAFDAMPAD